MKVYWTDREGKAPPSNCTFHWRPFSSLSENQKQLERVEKLPSPAKSLATIKKTAVPSKELWIEGIEKSLQMIRENKLQKVVLARCLTLELAEIPDPFAVVSALKERSQGAFLFCLQTPHFAFLGASPERLFSRQGRQIQSEALAGTRKRGETPEEDERLKQELLSSPKDIREFAFVQTYLKECLDPLCEKIEFSPLTIHPTKTVQHIYSPCKGLLKEGISDELLLKTLHPTPALCGSPKKKAFDLILEIEPFERGLYGGAIGWRTCDASEWIVGIRSCFIVGKTVKLYTGTGIVEGSDPLEEWNELDQKLKLYDGIFL